MTWVCGDSECSVSGFVVKSGRRSDASHHSWIKNGNPTKIPLRCYSIRLKPLKELIFESFGSGQPGPFVRVFMKIIFRY